MRVCHDHRMYAMPHPNTREYVIGGYFGGYYDVPAFCHECGTPYPWTEAKIEATKALMDEQEELSDKERELLKASLDNLVRETPQTPLAESRFKRIMSKLGSGAREEIRALVSGIVSEAIRKSIFGL